MDSVLYIREKDNRRGITCSCNPDAIVYLPHVPLSDNVIVRCVRCGQSSPSWKLTNKHTEEVKHGLD